MNISYKDYVTNERVRLLVNTAIGKRDDLLTIVKQRKLRWCGHVSRSSGLTKTILQRKRWEDNIKDYTGLNFATTQRAAEYRGTWRRECFENNEYAYIENVTHCQGLLAYATSREIELKLKYFCTKFHQVMQYFIIILEIKGVACMSSSILNSRRFQYGNYTA